MTRQKKKTLLGLLQELVTLEICSILKVIVNTIQAGIKTRILTQLALGAL